MRYQKTLVLGLVILLSIGGFAAAVASTDTVKKKDRGKTEEQEENDRFESKDDPDLPWPQREQNPENTRRSPYTTKYIDHSVTWKHDFAKNSSMTLVGKDGPVYIDPLEEKRGSEIVFLNSSDGSVKKRVQVDPENLQLIALTPDGILTSSNKTMYAFDRNGEKRWSLTLFGTVNERSGKYEDGAIYIVAQNLTTYDNKLYCINSQGKIQWTLQQDITTVAVGDDGVVYAGNGSALYALEQGAKEKWNVSFGRDARVYQISLGPQGTIYINEGNSGKIHAVDKTGEIKWSKDLSNNYIWGPAIAENGNIYVTRENYDEGASKLYCLNPDGEILWNFSADKRNVHYPHEWVSSPVVGGDGRIYFSAWTTSGIKPETGDDFILFSLSPNGEEIWNYTYNISTKDWGRRQMIGRYGKIYHILNNTLHTFGYPFSPLPSQVKDLKAESTEEKVKLSWNKTPTEKPPVTGYRIYRGSSAEDLDFLTEINGTTYTDSGLTQGRIYHYRVSAVNVFGEGKKSEVVSGTPETVPLEAVASANETTVEMGKTVSFHAGDSTDNFKITSYRWNFSDGNSSSGMNTTHTFTAMGVYTVTLTVRDAAGNTDEDTLNVTVVDGEPPVAKAGDDRTVKAGEDFALNASNSSDNIGIANYTWTIGGEEYYGKKLTHSFSDKSTHNITLTVKDEAGNTDSDTVTITVEKKKDKGSPGFTLPILVISTILVLIYRRESTEEEKGDKKRL